MNDFIMTANTSTNYWDFSYTVDSAGDKIKIINTKDKFVDRDIKAIISIPASSTTVNNETHLVTINPGYLSDTITYRGSGDGNLDDITLDYNGGELTNNLSVDNTTNIGFTTTNTANYIALSASSTATRNTVTYASTTDGYIIVGQGGAVLNEANTSTQVIKYVSNINLPVEKKLDVTTIAAENNLINLDAEHAHPSNINGTSATSRTFTAGTYCIGLSTNNFYADWPVELIEKTKDYIVYSIKQYGSGYGVAYSLPPVTPNSNYIIRGNFCVEQNGGSFFAKMSFYDSEGNYLQNYLQNNGFSKSSLIQNLTYTFYQKFQVPANAYYAVIIFGGYQAGNIKVSNVTLTPGTLESFDDLSINNNTSRYSSIINSGVIYTENSGSVAITSVTNTSGYVEINAYNNTSLTGSKSVVVNGQWVQPSITAAGTYYGKINIENGDYSASINSHNITTIPEVTTNLTGSINNITTTAQPGGIAGTDYWEIIPNGSITTTGISSATAIATITSAGFLETGNKISATSSTKNIEPNIISGTTVYLTKATFANTGDTSNYADISQNAPVLISDSYLYINAGYTPNVRISLAQLVPDGSNITTSTSCMLQNYSAYDNDGKLIAGTIPINTSANLSILNNTVNVASGYYANNVSVNISTATLSYTGGSVTSTLEVSGSNVTLGARDTGIQILSNNSVTRTAVNYNSTTSGYVSVTANNAVLQETNTTTSISQYITGVTLAAPESGTRTFMITVPNGTTADYIDFVYRVDSSGNVFIESNENLFRTLRTERGYPSSTASTSSTLRKFTFNNTYISGITLGNNYNDGNYWVENANNTATSYTVKMTSGNGIAFPFQLDAGEKYNISASITTTENNHTDLGFGIMFYGVNGNFLVSDKIDSNTGNTNPSIDFTVPATAYYTLIMFRGNQNNGEITFSNLSLKKIFD